MGFAFPNAPARLGMYANTLPPNTRLNPLNRPLIQFEGNTAHSAGFYWSDHGSCIYVGAWFAVDDVTGVLTYNSGRHERDVYINGTWTTTYHLFKNTKAFLCNKGDTHGHYIMILSSLFLIS